MLLYILCLISLPLAPTQATDDKASTCFSDNERKSGGSSADMSWKEMVPIDWEGRVFAFPYFLSKCEIEHAMEVGKKKLGDKLFDWLSDDIHHNDPILQRIEDKIAEVSMIPAHENEMDFMFTVRKSSDFTRVHTDKIYRENRVMTVILYLSDEENDGLIGGYTLFPALGGDPQKNNRLRKSFERGFVLGHRANEDHPKCFDCDAGQEANQMCATLSGGVTVKPKKGMALMFWDVLLDGAPSHLTWHAACPIHGGLKYTMQKFKEFPRVRGQWTYKGVDKSPPFYFKRFDENRLDQELKSKVDESAVDKLTGSPDKINW